MALLLLLAGLQQVEAGAAAADMATLNWKPFIYGGMASIVAEFGRLRDAPRHTHTQCHVCADILDYTNVNSCLKKMHYPFLANEAYSTTKHFDAHNIY